MTKRDYTNQHGIICPTENEAIRNADRKPEKPIKQRKPHSGILREGALKKMDRKRRRYDTF